MVNTLTNDIYEKLADALDKLPNAFPRTKSRSEIAILKKIFSPEEASLACQLSGHREPLDAIAKRVGLPVEELRTRLGRMAQRGLVLSVQKDDKPLFRLAPFVVGIYEAQLDAMDHELAHLVEDYLANGGAAGIMKPQPALHRVIQPLLGGLFSSDDIFHFCFNDIPNGCKISETDPLAIWGCFPLGDLGKSSPHVGVLLKMAGGRQSFQSRIADG